MSTEEATTPSSAVADDGIQQSFMMNTRGYKLATYKAFPSQTTQPRAIIAIAHGYGFYARYVWLMRVFPSEQLEI